MTSVWLARAGWLLFVAVAALAAFWAGGRFAETPPPPTAEPADVEYEVVNGEVEFSQSFAGRAQWDRAPGTPAAVSGTVTSVSIPADGSVTVGQVVMTVNLRPVVAALGDVPAFRALERGVVGQDVAQLQRMLRELGFDAPDTGRFDSATVAAVRSWQRSTGFAESGEIALGDVLFLPSLPGRLALAEGVRPGVVVAAGDVLFDVLAEAPDVTVALDAAQVSTVPQDAGVTVRVGEHRWEGAIDSSTTLDDGTMVLALTSVDGSPICGADCAAIPSVGALNVAVDVIVTPSTVGPVVPTSAVGTTPSGKTVVRMFDGQERSVQVLASARGLAVLDGLRVGEHILIPAVVTNS